MFFQFIRVCLILLIIVICNVNAQESNTTYSKAFTSHSDTHGILAATFSPDGQYLISGGSELVIWDIKSTKPLKIIPCDPKADITSLSFSPDGKYLLSSGYDNVIKLWDAKTWKVIKEFYNDTESIYLTFSLDMKYILSGNGDRYINWDHEHESEQYIQKSERWHYKLWEIASEKKLKDFNQTVDKETLTLFDLEDKDIKPLKINMSIEKQQKMYKQIEEMQKVRSEFNSLRFTTFSPDKKHIIALHFIAIQGNYSGALVLWNAQTMQIVKEFKRADIVDPLSIEIHPKSGNILTTDKMSIKLWNPLNGTLIKTYPNYKKYSNYSITQAKYNTTGTKIIATSGEGFVIIDGTNNEIIQEENEYGSKTTFLKLSSDDKYLFIGETHNILSIFDLKNKNDIQSMGKFSRGKIAITADENYAVVGENTPKQLKLWDLKTGKVTQTFEGEEGYTDALSISFDGKYVAAGRNRWKGDKEIYSLRLWNMNNFKEKLSFKGHTDNIVSVAFSPDNQYLLSGSWDGTMRLWDIKSGKVKKIFYNDVGVGTVAFSKDMRHLYTTGFGGTIKIWDIINGKELLKMMAFSDDNWLSITPEGYFTGSTGVLKHLNITKYTEHGMEPFDISQFYDHFFRPHLVKLKLSGDEAAFQKETKGLTYQDALKSHHSKSLP